MMSTGHAFKGAVSHHRQCYGLSARPRRLPLRRWRQLARASPEDNKPSPDPRRQRRKQDPDEQPPQPKIDPKVARFAQLLVEYGGVNGTIAVIVAFFTHLDPFGNLHYSSDDILLALKLFLPVLLVDALILVPDYSADPSKAKALSKIFLGDTPLIDEPETSSQTGASPSSTSDTSASSNGTSSSITSSSQVSVGISDDDSDEGEDVTSSALHVITETTYAATANEAENKTNRSDAEESSLVMAGERVKVSLDILQNHILRNNPTAGISPLEEFGIILISCLADEMLYRAVSLSLLSLWLRDRFYEAGFDDDVILATGQSMATSDFAKASAVGVTAVIGVLLFVVNARVEQRMLNSMQVVATPEGKGKVDTEAVKAQLLRSMGLQNLLVYSFEAVREVAGVVAAGAAFFLTGNLAGPYIASVASQTLLSGYQRLGYERMAARRARLMQRMEAARQRALQKLKEKVKKLDGSSSSSSSEAQQQGDDDGYVSIFGKSSSKDGSDQGQ